MPTILMIEGFRFFFFSLDKNEPIHIHVKKGSGDGKVWLEPVTKIEYMFDFKSQEERRIMQIVEEHREFFINKWNEYFN